MAAESSEPQVLASVSSSSSLAQWVRREATTTDIVVIGSMSVVAELEDQGLVQEYRLLAFPTALGAGRGLFRGRRELMLVSSEQVRPAVLAVLAPEPEKPSIRCGGRTRHGPTPTGSLNESPTDRFSPDRCRTTRIDGNASTKSSGS